MNDITALVQRLELAAAKGCCHTLLPDDCRALVEALEKAQRRIAELEGSLGVLEEVYISAADEVSELESRTVTVRLPEYRNSPDMHTKQYYEAIGFNQGLDGCVEALTAAGIQVIEGEQKNG